MEILFEDSEILVCVKPVGLLSQADSNGKTSMVSLLAEYTGQTVYPVHRLDKDTGGLMIYAKTAESAAKLSKDIADRRMIKEYLALVHGVPEEACEMCDLLFRDRAKNKSYVVSRMRRGVKEAKLSYRRLCTESMEGSTVSLVSVRLATGRTHQIRVQFSHRKTPLAGDKKYGAKDGFSELQLWSYRMTFFHPKTKEKITFSAEPTGAIQRLIKNGKN